MKTDSTYNFINAAFCIVVVLSNIISAKLLELPFLGIIIPAGLLTYPLTFLLSDFVTELYGAKQARTMVYTALAMNVLSFAIIQLIVYIPSNNPEHELAFKLILGLSGLRIFSSVVAYLVSQLVDIQLYAWIKRLTQDKFLWLRNNGSTWVSQGVDTVIIDMIYLYGGLSMSLGAVAPIMAFSFVYKIFFSLVTTPFLYMLLFLAKGRIKKSEA